MVNIESLSALIEQAKQLPTPDLVKASGLPRQTVVDVISGNSANPGIRTITAIAKAVELLKSKEASRA